MCLSVVLPDLHIRPFPDAALPSDMESLFARVASFFPIVIREDPTKTSRTPLGMHKTTLSSQLDASKS